MKCFLRFGTVLLTTIFLLLTTLPAFSQYQYQLTPSISVSEEYNDNINAAASDGISDYITGLTPAINFDILTQNTTLDLRYAP
jgi:hypothetical protein